jgi:hypothetical protein
MSSAPIPAVSDPPPPIPDFWMEKPITLPTAIGLNRTNWDLRLDCPGVFSRSYEINANPGQTPQSPEGPLALPGVYTLTLTVDGKSCMQTVTVRNDPRSPASFADLHQQFALQMSLYRCTQEAWGCFQQIAGERSSVAALLKANPAAEVATAAHALDARLAAIGGSPSFGGRFGGAGGGLPGAGAAPRQTTFYAVNSMAVRRLNTLDSGDMAPGEAMRHACAVTCSEFEKAMKSWDALKVKDLPAFNALLARNNLKPIGNLQAAASPSPNAR